MTDTVKNDSHDIAGAEAQPDSDTVSLIIDGRQVTAHKDELLIEAAERHGIFIPRFCYHPHMDPVGMCRMCLVEVSSPRGFSLQPSCYLKVQENMEVKTSSEKAKRAQEGVLELLLINHPLDCPVCDKGGECPLQDQDMSHGPGESRFIEEKRHFDKPVEIGPLTYLDRERCIQCARCTRFAAEIAGDPQIDFAGRGDQTIVATSPTQPFDSYFSGNTVQICPVGALTSKAYRFKSRPWDLEQAETTCMLCSVGCRQAAQSSAGALVRYLGIDDVNVNQSWLCDKGRYSFEALQNGRILAPLARHQGRLEPVRWADALADVTAGIRSALSKGGNDQIAVIGGSKFVNEDAYLWARLAKGVLGSELVDASMGDDFNAELALALPRATINETVNAKTVVLVSADPKEELPVLYLRLYPQLAKGKINLIEITPTRTSLSSLAKARIDVRPGELFSVIDDLLDTTKDTAGTIKDALQLQNVREMLTLSDTGSQEDRGQGVVFVIGRSNLAESPVYLEESVKLIAAKMAKAKFLPALRRGNIFGALDMGLAPNLLPGRVNKDYGDIVRRKWGTLPEANSHGTTEILSRCAKGEVSVLILLASDPLSDFFDQSLVEKAFENTPFIVALASHEDPSAMRADVVLPICHLGEMNGTVTNIEGRVSTVNQKVMPPALARQPWIIASDIARLLDEPFGLSSLEEISSEISEIALAYKGVSLSSLRASSRRDGVVVPLGVTGVSIKGSKRTTALLDPIATPGIASAEEQGAPMKSGYIPESFITAGETDEAGRTSLKERSLVSIDTLTLKGKQDMGLGVMPEPKSDKHTLRLVLKRDLYDMSTTVLNSPTMTPLVDEQEISLSKADAERFSLTEGSLAKIAANDQQIVAKVKIDSLLRAGVAVLKANKEIVGSYDAALTKSEDDKATEDSGDQITTRAELLIDAFGLVTEVSIEPHDSAKESR
ncbi:MAG: NADH-quinone oxidoreductase subunit NuoG [Firmicutes bacterium]|nr:NADH-quinone oxidoreductase subunit NuoG [Bacillota bacterium]